MIIDPFVDAQGKPRVLWGVGIVSNSTRVAELAGLVGFDTVWIEVEHGTLSHTEVQTLCMAAEAAGIVPTVRIQDNQRTHVLRALEAGARIVVVPMINTAEEAQQIVEHGKFTPLGNRGFNMNSRGVRYGLEPPPQSLQAANARTHLFAQIETVQAAKNVKAICGVEGLAGILIGPGDLSVSLGKCAQFTDPELTKLVVDTLKVARACGKHAGIMAGPGPLLKAAVDAGADLIFAGSDLAALIKAWRALLEAR